MLGTASGATRYVWQDSPSPGPPYTNWFTAATNIQDAVDAAQTGDTVLVAGGVYATGGRAVGTSQLVNRVAIDRAITVQSLMGLEVTSIVGSGPNGSNAVRCVYLTHGAVLAGFTLTNGATQTSGDWSTNQSGGGVWCESGSAAVSNCVLTGNSAYHDGGGNYYYGTFNYCCTTPLPANGVGNITNAPLFVDTNGWSNLRLQTNSPCINAGLNAYAPGPMDLDGLPRIVSSTVDLGAYEFQGLGSVISYAWLWQYGLPTDGSAEYLDTDYDGHNNWQEWRCQTDPTNPLSVLRLLSASPAGTPPGGVTVAWQSVTGVNNFLGRSRNLSANPPFTLLAPNLPGQSGATSFTHTNLACVGDGQNPERFLLLSKGDGSDKEGELGKSPPREPLTRFCFSQRPACGERPRKRA